MGGRAATGKILDDVILRLSPSYPPRDRQSAKSNAGPRNPALIRETSQRRVLGRIGRRTHRWQLFPAPRGLVPLTFPSMAVRSRRALPSNFPVLPVASPAPYTRRRSWVTPPYFPGELSLVLTAEGERAWTEELISPHPVDRYVDMILRRKWGISGGRNRLVHRGVGDLPPTSTPARDAGRMADLDRTAPLER